MADYDPLGKDPVAADYAPRPTKRVYRYEVPIDDESHLLPGGKVVLVDSRKHAIAEVWIEFPQTGGLLDMPVRAFGTGHDVPDDAVHLGSFICPESEAPDGIGGVIAYARGTFVWHLYAVRD